MGRLGRRFPIIASKMAWPRTTGPAGRLLHDRIGKKVQFVGDDLLVTNVERVAPASRNRSANALLMKVNQIGSLTESDGRHRDEPAAGWAVVTSHRSGETEDATIADIAVRSNRADQDRRPARSDRIAKYNQLLRIEEELGETAIYPGMQRIPAHA